MDTSLLSPIDVGAAAVDSNDGSARAHSARAHSAPPSPPPPSSSSQLLLPARINTAMSHQQQQQSHQQRQMLPRSRSSTDLSAFFRAIAAGNTERVKRAWLDGLALDVTDASGRTSLHIAVEHMRVGMIELLLSADVSTTTRDAAGRTPLAIAVDKQCFGIAEMLRAHDKHKQQLHAPGGLYGVNTTNCSNNNKTNTHDIALAFEATKRGDVQALQQFVPKRVPVDVQDYDGRTLLHIASAEGHVAIVQFLVVDCSANVNVLDRWGTAPLSDAIDFAHNDVARLLLTHFAHESGNRATIAVDQIDSRTLNAALEFALRVVTRKRWLMGQVYCPMTEESGNCVLVAHGVWHRNDSLPRQPDSSNNDPTGATDNDVAMVSPPGSPTSARNTTTTPSAVPPKDPIQMFRKVGSLLLIDPGQGHTGSVFSGQHPEWLNLTTAQQSHFFLLPYARRAGLQTIVSVPMIYKMSTIAVLSWYSDAVVPEDPLELQRIQRLLRSVMILSTLRLEVLAAAAGTVHVPRFQYCQSLDMALTANGELIDPNVTSEDVAVGDAIPLALEWGLFDMVDKLATSMSSEDHAAVIALLRSLVSLLTNGFFRDSSSGSPPRGRASNAQTSGDVVAACDGVIRTKRELLVHLRYYLAYLSSVSPTEGTIFMDAHALVPQVTRYAMGRDGSLLEPAPTPAKQPYRIPAASATAVVPPPEVDVPMPGNESPAATPECVLCKYNVSGHIHPGKAPIPAAPVTPVPAPAAAPSAPPSGESYFGVPGNPKSPVFRAIRTLLPTFEAQYDAFERKVALADRYVDGLKLGAFTSSDVYDAIGAAHDPPVRRTSQSRIDGSNGSLSPATAMRKQLLVVINAIVQDTTCLISYDQVLAIHKCLIPESTNQAGVIRSSAAVGYASPRIYRVFLPADEIVVALRELVGVLNDPNRWVTRPLLCAYYAFAVLVFYIHPFHDGNGRCGRVLCNVIAKKLGFPTLLKASDKTIQVAEFLQKAVVTIDAIQTSRRQSRQSRVLSAAHKENSSMWF